MRNWILALFITLSLRAQNAPKPQPPKLVLAIVIDQFRYDYLTRFHSEYTGGFKRIFDHGAIFTNARFEHVPTVTVVGHSTFLSGATPAMSGGIAPRKSALRACPTKRPSCWVRPEKDRRPNACCSRRLATS